MQMSSNVSTCHTPCSVTARKGLQSAQLGAKWRKKIRLFRGSLLSNSKPNIKDPPSLMTLSNSKPNIKDPPSLMTPFLKEHVSNTDAKHRNPSYS